MRSPSYAIPEIQMLYQVPIFLPYMTENSCEERAVLFEGSKAFDHLFIISLPNYNCQPPSPWY